MLLILDIAPKSYSKISHHPLIVYRYLPICRNRSSAGAGDEIECGVGGVGFHRYEGVFVERLEGIRVGIGGNESLCNDGEIHGDLGAEVN